MVILPGAETLKNEEQQKKQNSNKKIWVSYSEILLNLKKHMKSKFDFEPIEVEITVSGKCKKHT